METLAIVLALLLVVIGLGQLRGAVEDVARAIRGKPPGKPSRDPDAGFTPF